MQEEKNALFGLQTEQAQARLSVRKLKDEYSLYQKEGQNVVDSNNNMALSFKKTLAVIGGTAAIKKFVSDVLRIRGEFQQLDVAFTTLLQSKEKANALMAQMVQTAAKTPFNLTELATGARQLVAYGFQAEDINGTLIRLGNIASGLGLPLERLTYLYGTSMTQGRLYARDLMQFTTSGIPMLQGLADMYGVSTAKVNEMVTAGKIGFPEVQKVVENLTNEGGKFFNLMEEQSKTITGKISNLGDAMDGMFNSIGQANEGVINDSIDGLKYLVENYEQVGRILLGLVATYGTYRTALLINSVLELGSAKAVWTKITATKAATLAQATYNKVLAMNPYVAVGMAVVSLGVAMWALRDNTSAAEKAAKDAAKTMENMADASNKLKNKINELLSIIKDETATQYDKASAYLKLQQIMPDVFKNMDIEKLKLMDELSLREKINEAANRSNIVEAKTNMVIAQRKYDAASAKYKKDTDNGLVGAGSLAEKNESFMELEAAKKVVSEIEKIQSEANKQKKKEDIKPITQDKSYWEKQKKDAQSQLDALTDIEAAGKKGATLKDQINDYDKKINAFSASKTASQEEKEESAAEKLRKQNEKSAEELFSIRRQNQQDEINLMKEGTEKKLKQIELDYQKELDIIKKQESDWSKAQKGKLTQEQAIEISARYANADKKKEKSIGDDTKERLLAEQQALNEYLTKYGTFQQQKLAIAQEYAEKIKKAQEENGANSTQVKLLQKEQSEKTSAIDAASIKANMDWVAVFGEFGGMFSDMIKPALEEAKKYIKTDGFKNSDQADQKVLIDAINQMEKSLGGSGGLNFKKLGQDVQIYQNSLRELNNAKEEEVNAINKLKKAQEEYEKAIKNGTEEEKNAAAQAVDTAQQNANTASANVSTQTNIANQSQQGLSDTATNLRANMNNVTEGLSKLASGGIKNAYDGLIQAGKGMGGAMEKVADSLEDVPIIGWIVSIIDVFKDGLSNLVGGLLDAIFNAVSGIIGDVLSGDLFVTIGESLVTGISKILDAITFGGFGSWINAGESDETLKDDIELLSKSNEDLKEAIDNLAEKMDSASVADATDLYEQQKENLKEQLANTQEMMQRSGAAYSNGWIGIGGSHSSNAKINDAMSSNDWSRISAAIGKTVGSAGDFWNLTSEEMAKVAMDATDLYSKIKSYADDGYEDAGKYMDSYIEYYKQLEELENTWREKLTSASFDTIRDDFKSALMDMEADTEDFAANFEELMKNAIFESLMTEKYDLLLRDWYKEFATSMDGGKLTKEEQAALKNGWDDIVNQGIEERDALYDTMGWNKTTSSSSQDSTNGGFQTMSQDEGKELNGRFTAFQISNEEIKNAMLSMLISVNLISVSVSSNSITLIEIRNIMISSNSYLEDIAKYTKELIGLKQTIANIESSAKAMAGK